MPRKARISAAHRCLLLFALIGGLPGSLAMAQRVIVPSEASGQEIPGAMPGSASDAGASSGPGEAGRPAASGASTLPVTLPADTEPWPPAPRPLVPANGCSTALKGSGTTYDVGPGKPLTELDQVPWLSLQAGDVVNIHHRAQPYRAKVGLRAQGSETAPVVINGVTDADCRKPEVSGANAVTARDAIARRFFNKEHSENLGVFTLFRAPGDPFGHRAKHIHFRNLTITDGHPQSIYTAQDGSTGRYSRGAAGIYAVTVEHLVVENCDITRNGNGVFVNSKSREEASDHVIVRNSRLWDNGVPGSWFEHNLYIQTRRALYEGNFIGQLMAGARGSSMKDRSSATVVRFNHVIAAARAIDLVEIEDGVPQVVGDPLYPHAWVYGNLIENDTRLGAGRAWSIKMIHWGGDNDPRHFRRGTLHFYANTVRVRVDRNEQWWVALFDLPGPEQRVLLRGNIIQNLGSAELRLGLERGTIETADTNLFSGKRVDGPPGHDLRLRIGGRVIDVAEAGLDGYGRPRPGAAGNDLGRLAPLTMPAGAAAENLGVTHQHVNSGRLAPRPQTGSAPDLGAFELMP
ncbi:right-handed parallel beta-helix repeat-containing protein [Leptothrix discophora]|uniref:Right handed beta helix domain-containing protein n=1 Tax=Leptothrix discophora TaxID=89 RepID=A0ABT9G0Q8_LEPDI|nr:hypothetical protein [Leptothrix discophora]MDP4299897.1 hypothetical protein [Leptothrix discophora]